MFEFLFGTSDLQFQEGRENHLRVLYLISLISSFIVFILGPFILGIVLAAEIDSSFLLLWLAIPFGFLLHWFNKILLAVILGAFYDLIEINLLSTTMNSQIKKLRAELSESKNGALLVSEKEQKEIKRKEFKIGDEARFIESSEVSAVDPTVIPEGTKCVIKNIEGDKAEVALTVYGRYVITTVDTKNLKE